MSQNSREICWGEGEILIPPRRIFIASPKPNRPVNAVILSDRVLRVPTHFIDRRTTPHYAPVSLCAGCQLGQRPRVKGYLAGLDLVTKRYCVVELTAEAIRSNAMLSDVYGSSLRGMRLSLRRRGSSPNSAVSAELMTPADSSPPPPPFDLKAQLLTIWGVKDENVT